MNMYSYKKVSSSSNDILNHITASFILPCVVSSLYLIFNSSNFSSIKLCTSSTFLDIQSIYIAIASASFLCSFCNLLSISKFISSLFISTPIYLAVLDAPFGKSSPVTIAIPLGLYVLFNVVSALILDLPTLSPYILSIRSAVEANFLASDPSMFG